MRTAATAVRTNAPQKVWVGRHGAGEVCSYFLGEGAPNVRMEASKTGKQRSAEEYGGMALSKQVR